MKYKKTELAKRAEASALEAKKLSVAIARIQKERHSAEKIVANLLKNHAWIESEKSAFGVEGGDYDFKATDPKRVSQELQVLKSEQESLVSNDYSEMMRNCKKQPSNFCPCFRRAKRSTRR